jgi:hypothetical protein
MKTLRLFITLLIGCVCTAALSQPPAGRWSEAKANEWYAKQPWLVGSNYIPATAINELEMWQAETFDPNTIDKELGWAEGLGMTTMRVFLHDLLWQQDAKGYQARINQFLDQRRHPRRTPFGGRSAPRRLRPCRQVDGELPAPLTYASPARSHPRRHPDRQRRDRAIRRRQTL